jgi:hypothetical protein
VLKPMLLVAFLSLPSVRGRPLDRAERALLGPMIRRSDNAAAERVKTIIGGQGLRLLAYRAGMRRFRPAPGILGVSSIDAADQARYFLRIDRLAPARHRLYAMGLLASITPSQRWGIARARPAGWHLAFKGGWGRVTRTGWVDHQVGLFTRGDERLSVAILTDLNRSHAYGKETLRGVCARLLRGLSSAEYVP